MNFKWSLTPREVSFIGVPVGRSPSYRKSMKELAKMKIFFKLVFYYSWCSYPSWKPWLFTFSYLKTISPENTISSTFKMCLESDHFFFSFLTSNALVSVQATIISHWTMTMVWIGLPFPLLSPYSLFSTIARQMVQNHIRPCRSSDQIPQRLPTRSVFF